MPPKAKLDMKKAEQDRLQAMIIEMLREEDNKYCADCDAKQPRWASWNLGVFLCIRCAGIHRNLGVHLTKVKSVNLDSWTAQQVQSMRVMGNAKGRAVYEHALPKDFRRAQNDHSLEAFIRAKYEQKRYIMKDWSPPRVDVNDLSLDLKAEKEVKKSAPAINVSNGVAPTAKVNSATQPAAKEIQLLDFSDSVTVPSVAPSSQNNTDLFFNEPVVQKDECSTPAGDSLDDIFGPVVSAPPVSSHENGTFTANFDDFASFGPASTSETSANVTNGQPQALPSVVSAPSLLDDLSGLNIGAAAPPPSSGSTLTPVSTAPTESSKKSNMDILALFGSSNQSQPAPAPFGVNNSLSQLSNLGLGAPLNNGMSAETAAKFAAASPFSSHTGPASMNDLLGGLSAQPTATTKPTSANNFDFDFGGLTLGGSSANSKKSLWD